MVKTVDTDVVTLLLAHLSLHDSPYEIEVDFIFGKDKRFYKVFFKRMTLTGCGSFCLQSRVTINRESFPRQERFCSLVFYVQYTLLVGYGM